MKNQNFTTRLNRSLPVLAMLAVVLLFSSGAKASCKASYIDSVHGKTVSFFNTSSVSASHYFTYWSFGDGTTSTSTNPYHTYGDYNHTYTACLVVVDSVNNCRDTVCNSVTTDKAPCQAYFSASLGAKGKVSFTNYSTSGSGTFTSSWNFDDGSSSKDKTPAHTYANDGTYHVCLTITDSSTSCSSTYCQDVVVNNTQNCYALYSLYLYANGLMQTSNASTSSHSFTSSWNFGDGTTSTDKSPHHTYTKNGTYIVCLTIKDSAASCTSSKCDTINITTACTANLQYNANKLAVSFSDSNSTALAHAHSASWNFGDGSTGTGDHPSHTYSTSGSYYVCVEVTDSSTGCVASYCTYVVVSNCSIVASYSYTQSGRSVAFTSTSTTSSHTRYAWYFGDGSKDSTSGATVSHTYASTYNSVVAYLAIYDSSTGCTAYVSQTIVFCKISGYFSYTPSGLTYKFLPDSGNSANVVYYWTFGDGHDSRSKDPSHTYASTGTYTVCLKDSDTAGGCTAHICQTITVSNCSLTADFTDSIDNHKVKFYGYSNASTHSSVLWFFGDGTPADSTSGLTTSHTYGTGSNTYNVYLRVYDSTTKCLVYASHTISFCNTSAHFTHTSGSLTVKFTPDSTNDSTVHYTWSFGDGHYSKDKSPSHTYGSAGRYLVCLYDSNNTCYASRCDSITVTSGSATYCISGKVTAGKQTGYPGIVYLITYNTGDTSLTAIDSTNCDSAGGYEFCHLSNGVYYTKAALLATHADYKHYVPTYHTDATKWAKAKKITVNGASVTGADITMKHGSNKGGPGFIGGKIKAGANKTGDPEAGILVILYDSTGEPSAYTYSDANGNYGFDNIDYGYYSVEAEIPGKICYPIAVVINAANPSVNQIDMSVHSTSITASVMPLKGASIENTTVYPNPVTDKMLISINPAISQRVLIRIIDLTGKTVATYQKQLAAGQQTVELKTGELNNGMYLLQIEMNTKIMEARFIKSR